MRWQSSASSDPSLFTLIRHHSDQREESLGQFFRPMLLLALFHSVTLMRLIPTIGRNLWVNSSAQCFFWPFFIRCASGASFQPIRGNWWFSFLLCQAILTKLSSSFTLKLISAFKALNTLMMVSIVALFALLSSLEI